MSGNSLLDIAIEDNTTSAKRASSTAIGTRLVSNQKIEVSVGTKEGALVLGGSTNTTQPAYSENSETLGLYQHQNGSGQTAQRLNQTQFKGTR